MVLRLDRRFIRQSLISSRHAFGEDDAGAAELGVFSIQISIC
jgi:hypothetical protein